VKPNVRNAVISAPAEIHRQGVEPLDTDSAGMTRREPRLAAA